MDHKIFEFLSNLPDIIKQILGWKSWIRFTMITLIFGVIILGEFFFIKNISGKHMQLLQQQEQLIKNKIVAIYQQNSTKITYHEDDLAQLLKAHVMSKNNIEIFLLRLNQSATDNQIQINSIIPGQVESLSPHMISAQNLMQQSIAITASGQYLHCVNMINNLLESPYLFSIDSLEIIKKDSSNLSIFISISIYFIS